MTPSLKSKTAMNDSGQFRRHATGVSGFSVIELVIVSAVLISLAALGGMAYRSYMASVKETLSKQQNDKITEQVDTAVGFVVRGANAGLGSQVTGYAITEMSTCGEFLDALKVQLQDLRNPYDGSPAITFSSAYSWQHKRGKTRITCYRLFGADISNGRACKMKDASIMVTHFKFDCGGRCGDPMCEYPSGHCGGQTPGTWIYGGQIEKFYGKAEHRYYMLPDNTIATAPWGGPWPDFTYAQSVCPGYSMSVIPKEADY